jgi:putative two-component system response regulator
MIDNGAGTEIALGDFSDDLSTDLSEALAVLEQEQISVSLSFGRADDECHATLEQLLTGVRWLVPADGASIYLRRSGALTLAVVQNETLSDTLGEAELRRRLQGLRLAVNSSSIVGHVALTGHVVNIPDVGRIPQGSDYRFCPAIDPKTYRYRSLLTAPIINEAGAIVGVVQLVNALDDHGQSVPFGPDAEAIVRQFAAQAARVISGRLSYGRFPSIA